MTLAEIMRSFIICTLRHWGDKIIEDETGGTRGGWGMDIKFYTVNVKRKKTT